MTEQRAHMDERQRRILITELYEGGATYATIGRSIGLTRERVRQLIVSYELRLSPRADRAYDSAFPSRAAEVESLFLQLHDDRAVAEETGIDIVAVRRFVDESIPDPGVLRRKPKSKLDRFTDAELTECLQAAAQELESPMAHAHYSKWSQGRMLDDRRRWPGPQAAMLRFGSWRKALAHAGLTSNASAGPEPRFSLEDGVESIVAAWLAAGKPPSAERYDAWRAGRGEHPSVATVRKLVGNWDDLQLLAWPIVHDRPFPPLGSHRAQIDDDPSAPETLYETGGPYRRAEMGPALDFIDPFESDPQVVERALRAHGVLQNALADRARTEGHEPLSPSDRDPDFDVAWRLPSGMLVVVEVKATTVANLEAQLRLGLGQILRYGQLLQTGGEPVRHVLAVELMPDDTWMQLFLRLRVRLVTTSTLDAAFLN
jgi:hypothetical protein